MKWFCVDAANKITPVEIARFTKWCVFFPKREDQLGWEQRANRVSDHASYFPTFYEAKAHVVNVIKAEILQNELLLAGAKQRLDAALALKEATETEHE